MNPPPGKFITFEGGEGSGKSTQAARLATFVKDAGKPVIATREPGGTLLGERVRELVLYEDAASRDPLVAALLFNAARADHLAARIRPALEKNTWVICDRFFDSTRAYQGAAGLLDPAILDRLEEIVVGPTRPDLTILCDLDPTVGLSRARARRRVNTSQGAHVEPDPFEGRDIDFHRRLRAAFLELAAAEPDRFAVIDASPDADAVSRAIIAAVTDRLLVDAR